MMLITKERKKSSVNTSSSTSLHIEGIENVNNPVSAVGNVFYWEFNIANNYPLPQSYTKVDDLIEVYERKDDRKEAIAQARKQIANKLYTDRDTIASLRLKNGLSQRQLASAIKSSQPHITRIESGSEDVRLSTIMKLADALGVQSSVVINALTQEK